MHTPTLIRPLAAALVCGLAFAACGSDDPATGGAPSGSSDRQDQNQEAMLAFAQCMREQGIDMPDPQPGQGGIRLRAPEGTSPEQMDAAQEACRKHLDDVEPPEISEEQREEFKEAALAHARCMREHGIDMPDPTFGANGRVEMRIDRSSGIDPESPEFKEAEEACRDELPQGAMRGEGSP
jgi:hypothetical protein